jgi:hypothetical protein
MSTAKSLFIRRESDV